MNKRNILIVEDQDGIRNLISATLRMKGFVIDKAENGRAALKMLIRNPDQFDLIISDYDMPRMNGQEFLSEVRSNEHLKNKPFMTFMTDIEKKFVLSKWAYLGTQSLQRNLFA